MGEAGLSPGCASERTSRPAGLRFARDEALIPFPSPITPCSTTAKGLGGMEQVARSETLADGTTEPLDRLALPRCGLRGGQSGPDGGSRRYPCRRISGVYSRRAGCAVGPPPNFSLLRPSWPAARRGAGSNLDRVRFRLHASKMTNDPVLIAYAVKRSTKAKSSLDPDRQRLPARDRRGPHRRPRCDPAGWPRDPARTRPGR